MNLQIGLHGQPLAVTLITNLPRRFWFQGIGGGLFLPMSNTRVVVFIDYQNVYHGARALFGGSGSPHPSIGNVHPLEFGKLLCNLGLEIDPNRVLTGVRVYRGQPVHGSGHEKVCRAFNRQLASWNNTPGVSVFTRPLRYFRAISEAGEQYLRGEEKGVEVMMALDIALGATNNTYDVAIAATADTDFLPAIEHALEVNKRVETSTWWTAKSPRGKLTVPKRNIWNHNLNKSHFDLVREGTDYLIAP